MCTQSKFICMSKPQNLSHSRYVTPFFLSFFISLTPLDYERKKELQIAISFFDDDVCGIVMAGVTKDHQCRSRSNRFKRITKKKQQPHINTYRKKKSTKERRYIYLYVVFESTWCCNMMLCWDTARYIYATPTGKKYLISRTTLFH